MGTLDHSLDEVGSSAWVVLTRVGEVKTCARVESDAPVSAAFMADHTQFDSFTAFVANSPWSPDEPEDIRQVPCHQLDDYVAQTTEFETWEELETRAAEEALVAQHLFAG